MQDSDYSVLLSVDITKAVERSLFWFVLCLDLNIVCG